MEENDDWWGQKPYRMWVRRTGSISWYSLGIFIVVALIATGLAAIKSLVLPIILAFMLSVIFLPLVDRLERWHFPRWLGAAICMVIIIALAVGSVGMVIYGLITQGPSVVQAVEEGFTKIKDGLSNVKIGEDTVDWIQSSAETATSKLTGGFASAVFSGLAVTASLLIGVIISLFILFFFLDYGHQYREYWSGHMGIPREKAELIINETSRSVRGYFLGTAIIAVVNAVTVLIPALILGLPLLGSIVAVTFITAFIPSVGGYIGGAFVVILALGAKGLNAALIMLVVVILANTLIQQPVQAVAYGATLNISPLIALLVTILGGILAGIAGAILAAPLTAIVMQVYRELKRAESEMDPPLEEETVPKKKHFRRKRKGDEGAAPEGVPAE
ncbi:MAG: AI-2E family transporter [Actinobacteria bacterium]|nr:AI-2E family transporter [Actinomycetota bacterium]